MLLSAALIFTAPLFAREKTDVLVMKNGDRMTCQIKGLDSGVLYVSFDYIDGTTSVEWSKVARLESNQLFIVKTEDGSVYTGKLSTAETPVGRPVKIQIAEIPEAEKAENEAALIAAEVSAFRFNKTNLNLTATLSPALSVPGRFRFNTNASYYIKLFSNLSWNVPSTVTGTICLLRASQVATTEPVRDSVGHLD